MMLGEKIKELRKMSEITQEELAEKLDVSRSAVAKWESNNGIPDIVNLKKISEIFSVSIDSLVDYKENLREKNTEVRKVNISKYVGQLCDIELVGWNDGVSNSYIVNEDLNFFYYQVSGRKNDSYGCISKQLIKEISIKPTHKNNVVEKNENINLDYFIGRQVDIELVKEKGLKGFLDFRDDDLMSVIIKSLDSESVILEFGKRVHLSDICKIEEAQIFYSQIIDFSPGFRVIIVIEANSYVNIRSSRLLPKFKTQKINSWCAAQSIHFNNGYCKQHTNKTKDSLKSLIS